jgi:hypothetical protein
MSLGKREPIALMVKQLLGRRKGGKPHVLFTTEDTEAPRLAFRFSVPLRALVVIPTAKREVL